MGGWRAGVLLVYFLALLTVRVSSSDRRVSLRSLSTSLSQNDGRQSDWLAPRIMSVKGFRFKAFVNETALTSVIVSDLYGSARVSCSVACSEAVVRTSCPAFERTTGAVSLFIGSVFLNASSVTDRLEPLLFNLTCSDSETPSRTSTVNFSVTLVRNETSAYHEPAVTRRLISLAAEPLRQKTPQELLSFVETLLNGTQPYGTYIAAVNVALAGAIAADIVETLRAERSGSYTLFKRVIQFINNVLGSTDQALRLGEAQAGLVSQLFRISNRLVDATETASWLNSNETFALETFAVGAAKIPREVGKDSVISFGAPDGLPSNTKMLSAGNQRTAGISVRAGQIVDGRVGFVMIDPERSWAIFSVKGGAVLSPMYSVCGQVEGDALLTFTVPYFTFIPFPLFVVDEYSFCASWDAQNRSWNRRGCGSTTVSDGAITCRCSRHTNLALLSDTDALDHLWNGVASVIFVVGLVVVSLALCFTILAHCCYARRKWTSSRERQASTILAVERSWITIIMCVVVLAMELNLAARLSQNYEFVMCLGSDTVSVVCYLLFAFMSVLEGWQAFLCLVSRIVLNSLHTTNLGSVYGCFNRSFGVMVFFVVLLTVIFYLISYFGSLTLKTGSAMFALCQLTPGLPTYLGVVLPVSLCFAADMAISGLLGYAIVWRSARLPQKHRSRSRSKAVGYVAVCVTFFALSLAGTLPEVISVPSLYSFLTLTVLLGAVYFAACCLMRAEIRKEAVRLLGSCRHTTRNDGGRDPPIPADHGEGEGEERPLLGQVAT